MIQAVKQYKEYTDKNVGPNLTMKDMIKQDFAFFKKNGFDSTLMKKALAALYLEKPESF